jgi:hypothetical protein
VGPSIFPFKQSAVPAVQREAEGGGGRRRKSRRAKSMVVKRSILIAGRSTSVTLEDAFWKGLNESAGVRRMTLSNLVASIGAEGRRGSNLSSATSAGSCSISIASKFLSASAP